MPQHNLEDVYARIGRVEGRLDSFEKSQLENSQRLAGIEQNIMAILEKINKANGGLLFMIWAGGVIAALATAGAYVVEKLGMWYGKIH